MSLITTIMAHRTCTTKSSTTRALMATTTAQDRTRNLYTMNLFCTTMHLSTTTNLSTKKVLLTTPNMLHLFMTHPDTTRLSIQ